ncbi:MAG: glycosyltransferase family 9 protein [Gemmatimonadota bacterium]|nr:glycosyltransferase family 9 protein [Gemmatimonadota bacterium]
MPASRRHIPEPSRILLVSLDNVGDLVFASALTPALRERFPDARLDIWCKAYAADVAHLIPGVSLVIASDPYWDRAPGSRKGSRITFLRALRELRRNRYDLAVLASSQWRVAASLALVRVPHRVGRRRKRNERWLTHLLPEENRTRPVVAELGGIAFALGATPRDRYRLDATLLEPQRGSFARSVGAGPRVALHAFAGSRARCVPLAEWRAVADTLVRRGVGVLWIGSPAELADVRAAGASPEWHFADAVGNGSLRDAAALISLCDAFIGHDSGPMHVAAALSVPVLGIFAPGEPERTFPQGPGPSRVVARPSPAGITADVILRELDLLGPLEARSGVHR